MITIEPSFETILLRVNPDALPSIAPRNRGRTPRSSRRPPRERRHPPPAQQKLPAIKTNPTDVLSFPAPHGLRQKKNTQATSPSRSKTAARQAKTYGHTLAEEKQKSSCSTASSHLSGGDHETDQRRTKMATPRDHPTAANSASPPPLIERATGNDHE